MNGPFLHSLLFPVRRTAAESKVLRDQQITLVQPGDIVYVDIRSFQYDLYDDLNLDDKYHLRYVVHLEYTRWAGRQQRSIDGFVNVFQTRTTSTTLWCSRLVSARIGSLTWSRSPKGSCQHTGICSNLFLTSVIRTRWKQR